MFRIKICGITNVRDAIAAAESGADAVGLNFYRRSKRFIELDEARRVADALDELVLDAPVHRVGVFVNEQAEQLRAICRDAALRVVQLHGDEPPEYLQQLNEQLEIVRARKLDARGLPAIEEDLQACRDLSCCPKALLIDSAAPGQYGGTGETVDWSRLVGYEKALRGIPLVLAGGLTPENVGEAIRRVCPAGVDVVSGVESAPGKKDAAKVRDFVAAAREAFAASQTA